jgi:hypothetical protein
MKTGLVRPACLLLITLCFSVTIFAQVTTSGRLVGVVTDSAGALVPNAEVIVTNIGNKEEFKTTANDEGGWSIPSVPNGTYTIKITAPNFKTTVLKDVKVDTGQVTSANATLEPGEATAEVVIQGAGEILQTESANVATTIVGRQIVELPFVTRDALQLVLTLPGVQTPGVPRTSSINGLPKGSVDMTLDGVNIQDNFLRSSDGFFTSIQMKSDAVQEVTVSTAVPGSESSGDGAAQIRAVTKSGTSDFHGGAFWQYRSPRFNSNYYFNNIDGLPRDSLFLRQMGGNIGGPILIPKLIKNRNTAFFFLNYEEFRLPQAYGSLSAVGNILVLTPEARQGIFRYRNAAGTLITVDLLALANNSDCNPTVAGLQRCPSTLDPTVASALATINAATLRAGALRSRTLTGSPQAQDFNRLDYQFQDPGNNIRRFPTARFDWNITKNQHFEFVHNYQHYFADPDAVNGQNSVVPGEGIVIGTPGITGSIYRNTFSYAAAHRWTISNRLINELRATFGGNGTSAFTREFSAGLFSLWGGYAVTGGTYLGAQGNGTGAFYNRRTTSRRNTPTKGLTENLTFVKGTHTLNFGGSFLRINSWTSGAGTQIVPQVVFGITSDDPMNTNVFTNTGAGANFPGASATQLGNAQSLYAYLVGRVSSINRSVSLDGESQKYVFDNFQEYNHQNQWAFYVQDSWKFRRNITLNYGLRWQFEPSAINDNLVYTRTGYDGIFGVSGTDHLFRPGTFGGQPTQFRKLQEGEKGFDTRMNDFAPSFGFAYSPDFKTGVLRKLLGENGRTVIRGGYSIAFTREGFNAYTAMFGSNEGGTVNLNVSPSLTPGIFPAGSVLFRNPATFPALPVPPDAGTKYPFTPLAGSAGGANDFNPQLKAGYTQSFTFGVQRELGKNTAVEVRFVRTRGTHLWRQYDLNEVNIFENGFLAQFNAARNNLLISRANNAGDNYGNQGLPGQVNVDVITVGLNSSTNSTMVTRLLQGQAGAAANTIAFNLGNMNRLIINGRLPNGTTCTIANPSCIPFIPSTMLPLSTGCSDAISTAQTCRVSNYFIVNPQTTGGAFLMTQGTDTSFNALQIEVRRRMSAGLLVQGSYQFGKALANAFVSSSSVFSQPRTLRNPSLDKDYSPWDVRHSFKLDYIYELPFGNGRHWLNNSNGFVDRVVGGWQIGGVTRIQSGPATLLTSGGRATVNQFDAGVVLHNITLAQFQNLVQIRKDPNGTVYWLPQDFIDNTQAAFASPTGAPLDPSKPYIGPPLNAGQLGERIVFHGPPTARFDINVVKRIHVTERVNVEGRVTFLNAFNRANFFIGDSDSTIRSVSAAGSTFGQTRSAYRDITVSGTNDPGGRLIEWQLRLNF